MSELRGENETTPGLEGAEGTRMPDGDVTDPERDATDYVTTRKRGDTSPSDDCILFVGGDASRASAIKEHCEAQDCQLKVVPMGKIALEEIRNMGAEDYIGIIFDSEFEGTHRVDAIMAQQAERDFAATLAERRLPHIPVLVLPNVGASSYAMEESLDSVHQDLCGKNDLERYWGVEEWLTHCRRAQDWFNGEWYEKRPKKPTREEELAEARRHQAKVKKYLAKAKARRDAMAPDRAAARAREAAEWYKRHPQE